MARLENNELRKEMRLDDKKLLSIGRRVERAVLEANKMGLILFAGSCSISFRHPMMGNNGSVISVKGQADGGDGGDEWDDR